MSRPRRQRLLWFATAAFSVCWIAVFAWVATRDPIFAAAAYAALGDVTTLAALGAGIAAFVINVAPYREWKRNQARSPCMAVVAAIHGGGGHAKPVSGAMTAVDGLDIPLQVTIRNTGDAPLHDGIVTISVLAECDIHPVELRPRDSHYLLKGIYVGHSILADSQNIDASVRMTVIERTFPPGDFVYAAGIRTPNPGRWPILITISGEPPPNLECRINVATGGTHAS